MDLQVRKFRAIEYLIHLQDEVLYKRIQEIIYKNQEVLDNIIIPFSE